MMESIDFSEINEEINSLLSEKIADHINDLEAEIFKYKEKYNKLDNDYKQLLEKTKQLEQKIESFESFFILKEIIKEKFESIESGEKDKNGYYDSKQKLRYIFIKNILKYVFNIEQEYNGWQSYRSDGSLPLYLAINFYSNKDILIKLLKALHLDERQIKLIEEFKMPFDWEKEKVIKFVKNPQYNTNGRIFEVNNYWIEEGADIKNLPYSLIMKNKYILEDDVFNILLETINLKKSNFHYLFSLPIYNSNISYSQIQKLGETLILCCSKLFTKCTVNEINLFIKSNIDKFNKKTLDFLFKNRDKIFDIPYDLLPFEYKKKWIFNNSAILFESNFYFKNLTLEERKEILMQYIYFEKTNEK